MCYSNLFLCCFFFFFFFFLFSLTDHLRSRTWFRMLNHSFLGRFSFDYCPSLLFRLKFEPQSHPYLVFTVLFFKEIWWWALKWLCWIAKMKRVETLIQLSHKLGKLSKQLKAGRHEKIVEVSKGRWITGSIFFGGRKGQRQKLEEPVFCGLWFWPLVICIITFPTVTGGSTGSKETIVSLWEHCNHKGICSEAVNSHLALYSSREKLFVSIQPWCTVITQLTDASVEVYLVRNSTWRLTREERHASDVACIWWTSSAGVCWWKPNELHEINVFWHPFRYQENESLG